MDTIKNFKVVQGLGPDADLFDASPKTRPVHFGKFSTVEFVLTKGAGAVGTARLFVDLCDNPAADNPVAIPCKYDHIDADGTVIVESQDLTTGQGLLTEAAENQTYIIRVDHRMPEVASIADDKPYVRLSFVEVANDPVDAGVVILLSGGREGGFYGPNPTT
jgi:hypothetical protein